MRRLPPLAFLAGLAASAPSQDKVDFAAHVKPIFADHCYSCHGTKKQEADLRLDRRDTVFVADETKWVVRPGKPADSPMYKRITLPKNDPDVMPNEGEPLSAAQIDVIKRWIEQGAVWPAEEAVAEVKAPPVEVIEVKLSEAEQSAATAALPKLEARGAVVGPIAKDHLGIDVNLSLLRPAATDADLELVRGIGPALSGSTCRAARSPTKASRTSPAAVRCAGCTWRRPRSATPASPT